MIAFPVFGFSVRFLKQWPNSSTRDFAKFPCVALSARLVCIIFAQEQCCECDQVQFMVLECTDSHRVLVNLKVSSTSSKVFFSRKLLNKIPRGEEYPSSAKGERGGV